MIPLMKPDGGIRPIVIGEATYRLAARAIMTRLKPQLTNFQGNTNLVLAQAVIEKLTHESTQFMSSNPLGFIISLDIKNAFNEVSRAFTRKTIVDSIPELTPLYDLTYSRNTIISSKENKENKHLLFCSEGIQQGDPLGPALFAITIQPELEAANSLFPEVMIRAYADDLRMHCNSVPKATQAFEFLQEQLRERGLELSTGKSFFFGWNHTPSIANILRVESALGICLLGNYLGTQEYIEDQLDAKLDKFRTDLDKLDKIK